MAQQTDTQSFEGRWTAADPTTAFLQFGPVLVDGPSRPFVSPGEGPLSGSDGCNGVGGSYRPDGDTARISRGPSTLRACIGVDTWLRGVAWVRVDGDSLHVFDARDEKIGVLTRAVAD